MLLVRDLHKSFGKFSVLKGIDIFIEKGKVYTLTGGNGSGKTTLFNLISGFVKPTRGAILLNGHDIVGLSPYKINRLGIGRAFQDLRLAMGLSVRENVLLAMEKKMFERQGSPHDEKVNEILARVSLLEKANSLAGEISYGQQKLLTLACLIANNAKLMLIDEPIAGIDKANFRKVVGLVKELKKEGKAIIQIEHHNDYIAETSDYVFKMENGKIVC